ncbi:hypothetical protein BC829DRAFT_395960 [Chytridium lagenaria]|nr:hypothetical protein BC829DRAFT_395960 [Chytridium lagenaria]
MHDLNSRAATKYDTTNKAHERKLMEFWDLAMQNHPDTFQRVLSSSSHETSWFSMAVVGINITSFLISLKLWTQYATPLTVMDFGRVFNEFQGKIEKQLLAGEPTVLKENSPVFVKNRKTK